jgi:hypothetical protein
MEGKKLEIGKSAYMASARWFQQQPSLELPQLKLNLLGIPNRPTFL